MEPVILDIDYSTVFEPADERKKQYRYFKTCEACNYTGLSQNFKKHCKTKDHLEMYKTYQIAEELKKKEADAANRKRKYPEEYGKAHSYTDELKKQRTIPENMKYVTYFLLS